jgi:hypothetical protein
MKGRAHNLDARHNPIMRELSEPLPGTVHHKLCGLTRDLDPEQIDHIVLDPQSIRDLRTDAGALWDGSNGVRMRDGCMTWREIPLRVTVPPLKVGPLVESAEIPTTFIKNPRQITVVVRRRDNGRLFYVDHESNENPWKAQGSDLP